MSIDYKPVVNKFAELYEKLDNLLTDYASPHYDPNNESYYNGRLENLETYRINPVDYIKNVAESGRDEIGYLDGLVKVLLGQEEDVVVRKAGKDLIREYVKDKVKGSDVLGVYTPFNALYGLILISDELPGSITKRLGRYNKERKARGEDEINLGDVDTYILAHEFTHHYFPYASEEEVEATALKALELLSRSKSEYRDHFRRALEAGIFLDSLEYNTGSLFAKEVAKYYDKIRDVARKVKKYVYNETTELIGDASMEEAV